MDSPTLMYTLGGFNQLKFVVNNELGAEINYNTDCTYLDRFILGISTIRQMVSDFVPILLLFLFANALKTINSMNI